MVAHYLPLCSADNTFRVLDHTTTFGSDRDRLTLPFRPHSKFGLQVITLGGYLSEDGCLAKRGGEVRGVRQCLRNDSG